MIKLQIVGNIGKDCIVKEVQGKNVINFSVAHTERFKDAQGAQKERTTWVECSYWTDKTGIAQYLTKGKIVYVEGAPTADAYMNKDNQASATLRLRVGNIQLLGGNQPQNGQTPQPAQQQQNRNALEPAAAFGGVPDAIDDLPF